MVLAFVLGLAAQVDRLDKSDAQILAMGRLKWFEYFTTRQGDSNAAMRTAENTYGEVLKRANDRLIAKAHAYTRTDAKEARERLTRVGTLVLELEECYNGGGTLYQVARASIQPDVEEVVAYVLTFKGKSAPFRKPADVTKRLDALVGFIESNKARFDQMGFEGGFACAKPRLAELRRQVPAIIKLSQRRTGYGKEILHYCYRTLAPWPEP